MTNTVKRGTDTRDIQASVSATRKQVATSHEGKYAYFLDPDLYIYQQNTVTGEWVGWLCTLPVWESTFSHGSQFTLTSEVAA